MQTQNINEKSGNEKETNKTTKEKIFEISLDLFSKNGFNAVSVREIARKVGIRESSIYNHYKNKEAILDAIIDYFITEIYQDNLPDKDELIDQGPEIFLELGAKMFIEQISTPKMEKIWRLVSIEVYHNEKIRNIFKKSLLEEPINDWEVTFTKMIEKGLIKPFNPRTLAYEYFSFAIYLFFEYFVLRYDEDFNSFMDSALEKMNNHSKFMLEAIRTQKDGEK